MHIIQKLQEILSSLQGCVAWTALILANFFAGYETALTMTVLAVVIDGVWGVAAAHKQGRFTLSSLLRDTVTKLAIYGTAIVVFIAVDKLLGIADGLTINIVCAAIILVEFWSVCANALICFPRFPFLNLMRKALAGEIAAKMGITPQQVSESLSIAFPKGEGAKDTHASETQGREQGQPRPCDTLKTTAARKKTAARNRKAKPKGGTATKK